MPDKHGALIGCGFFARNHMHAWNEVEGADIVAVCDTDGPRAHAFAQEFGTAAYVDAAAMMRETKLANVYWRTVDCSRIFLKHSVT